MPSDRDAARAEIARQGLASAATERIARTSFGRMPITLVDRARGQLREFFSDHPWTVEDDAALSALVGPGTGWTDEELAPGVKLAFGWRAGAFKIDVAVASKPAAAEPADAADAPVDAELVPLPVHERTLGDTFEDTLVIESGRTPNELRFAIGPGGSRGLGRYTPEEPGELPGVIALFADMDSIESVRIEMGYVTVTVTHESQWPANLLRIFDIISLHFVPPRTLAPDRQYERALAELGPLDASSPRDVARILDGVTSPDAAYRRVAVAKLEDADPLVVTKPWTRAMEDSSRAVRRATMRAASHKTGTDRLLFERALTDKDACVRYYALRGLAQVGVGRADQSVQRRLRDDDIRVRMAAGAALDGETPA
jgi:hypothetical protein